MLELRLLGAFELRAGGEPVTLTSTRAQAVLACLALRGGTPYGRKQLAFALWPGSTEQQARTNLRHVLHTLRGAVPGLDGHLRVTPQTLTLTGVTVDVAALGGSTVDELRAAADAYRGDLLEGWYDDWVTAERDECRRRIVEVLNTLVPLLEQAGDRPAAIRYAERLRALERLAEEPYRLLIRLYDAIGDRARAVRTYHECAAMLRDELGVTPSEETLSLYAVLLPPATPAPVVSAVAPFVAREDERRRLISLWRRAAPAHLVVVGGEPGIGKSRLAEEFRLWAARQGAATASARSYPAEGELAYAPVVAWLRRLGVGGHESGGLEPLLPDPDQEQGARLRLFEAMERALRPGPGGLLLVADDLHAADRATCQFVHYLVRESPGPLLVVATARIAEIDPGHPAHTLLDGLKILGRCTELPLERLDRDATTALAGRLGHRMSGADAARLHAETEGNPLFVVETLRAGWDALTPRVQAVLEARLRQLSPYALELAGIAAVAGSSVPVGVLIRQTDEQQDPAAGLDELWRRQILVTGGGDTYDFSHDKLREVAYRMLPPARRRHHHALVAAALREMPDVDTVAGRIAVHLLESGARDDAVDWFVRAAQAAQRVYADAEAVGLLLRAAGLVRGQDRELDVLTAVPGPLSSAEGYASPRLREVLDRALAIAGPAPAAPLLRAQAMAVLSRGDFQAALRHGAELRALGEDDDVLAVEGDFVQGVAAAWRADNAKAREHLSAALARYRPGNRSAHLLAYGQDPQVLCLVRLAHVFVRLGDPGEARRRRDRALELARAGGHPFTLGGALLFAALCDLDLGDRAVLPERAAELNEVCAKVEAAPIRVFAQALNGLLEGWPGLSRIDAALADPGRYSAPGVPAMLLRLRLEAVRALDQPDEARATARRLLDDGVLIWDGEARAVLGER
ncbi:AAA family ATPase [Actinoplanes sp. LDG1-06]|uniref:AAA family ATPase n=1 Tax=Paractinoplanes ovalisporus TaxID=2810368 RepID=A0ABS2AGB4_9ACTN|nr:BTAD domain-containing putative transcriptional regulator [Actinoplanes ovalisporus]MBM2618289.1 AAA family ATPase [Actinoplanes ovalisporus]